MDMLAISLLVIFLAQPIALLAQPTVPVSSRITLIGAVYCDTCLNNGFSKNSYFMPGVDVHIQCKINADSPKTAEMITIAVNRSTDNSGVYKLEIPSVDGVDCIDGPPIQSFCQASLIGSSSTACNVPVRKATTDGIAVKSKQDNQCVYSFTPLSFRPRKRDDTLCRQRAADKSLKSARYSKFLLPPNYPLPTQSTSSSLQISSPLPVTNTGSRLFSSPSRSLPNSIQPTP